MKKKEEYLVDPNFFGTLREGLLDGEPITVAIEEIGPAMLAQLALDGPVQLEFKEPGSFARVSPPPLHQNAHGYRFTGAALSKELSTSLFGLQFGVL